MQAHLHKAKILDRKEIAQDTFELTIGLDGGFTFTAGQYIWLIVDKLLYDDAKGNRRAFSISSSPNRKNSITIAFRNSNSGYKKTLLDPLTSEVSVYGPFGSMVLPQSGNTPIVMVAGGIGITPFMSMIEFAVQQKKKQQIMLLYANSSAAKVAYAEKISELESENPYLAVKQTFKGLSWNFIVENVKDALGVTWYIIGPKSFVSDAGNLLLTKGIDEKNIIFEEFRVSKENVGQQKITLSLKDLLFKLAMENAYNHITLTDTEGKIVFVNHGAERITGFLRSEMINQTPRLWGGLMDPDFYQKLWRTVKEEKKPFIGEVKNRRKNGELYTAFIHISPIFDLNSKLIGFIGTEEDITENQRTKSRLTAQYNMASILIENDDIPAIYKHILEIVCRNLDWDFGSIWELNHTRDQLYCTQTWHKPDVKNIDEFEQKTLVTTFPPAIGLPGRVWKDLKPAWIKDVVVDDNFPRKTEAIQANLHGGFAFPIKFRNGLLGVMDFFSHEIREPDQDILDMFDAVSNQIGQFVVRKQNEQRVKEQTDILAKEQARDAAILGDIGEGVIVTDKDRIVFYINPMAENLLGFKGQEILGKPFGDTVPLLDAKENLVAIEERPLMQALGSGKKVISSGDYICVRKDKTKFPVFITASPLFLDGLLIGAVLTFRDITREKEIDKAKSEFVSLASHQLRTPLSAIKWYSKMLLDEDVGKITKKQREYLDEIHSGNDRMVSLVNALLNVSRIELGTFAVQPKKINIVTVCKEVIEEAKEDIAYKQLTLEEEFKKVSDIEADPNYIRIIFQNLITNAIKYTPEKGSITITIGEKASDQLICVKDTGFGIPEKSKDKIFTKLYRADNVVTKDADGVGLGLYITKSIIEQAAKGKIWFESAENKGTTFFVSLPLTGMIKQEGVKGLV